MQPVRHARRQRRNDRLVERLALECLAHRDERVGVADETFDVPARCLLQQRDRELEGQRRLLRLPLGLAHTFAFALGQLGQQVAHAVHGAVLAV
ncbi:MAG: hypothetical protein ACXVHX_30900 [Solirubrobacteraceae bacterium]